MKRFIHKIHRLNDKIKGWLQKNKIYFETLVMVSISIAGIFLSYMGLTVSKKANELSYQSNEIDMASLELQKNELLPILGYTDNDFDASTGYRSHYIVNTGDSFFNPEFRTYTVLSMVVGENGYDESGLYYKSIEVNAILPYFMEISNSYDVENKKFRVSLPNREEYLLYCDDIRETFSEELSKTGEFVVFPYSVKSYVVFEYKDIYIKEEHKDLYILPELEMIPFINSEILISDRTEEDIQKFPEFKIDTWDMEGYLDQNVEVLVKQFNENRDKIPKGYYTIEIE